MKVDFMILGAQKCATTTLFALLDRHPDLVGVRSKEPHFFSTTPDWRAHLEEYHALFDQRSNARYFDGSTSYTFFPHRNLEIWEDLYQYNPNLRFIYMVRDPIDRLVSSYMHNVARGYTDESIEHVVFGHPLLIDVTRYAMQIAPFIERFGREQVMLVDFQDFVSNRQATVQSVAAFLDLPWTEAFDVDDVHANKSIGKEGQHHLLDDPGLITRSMKRYMPPLYRWRARRMSPPAQEKPILSEKFRRAVLRVLADDIRQLEELLERDLSAWYQPNIREPDNQTPRHAGEATADEHANLDGELT